MSAALSLLRGAWSLVGVRGLVGIFAGWFLSRAIVVQPLQLDLAQADHGLEALRGSIVQADATYQRQAREEESRRTRITEEVSADAQVRLDALDRLHAADRARWLRQPPVPGTRAAVQLQPAPSPAPAGQPDDADRPRDDCGVTDEDRRVIVEARSLLEVEAERRRALIDWAEQQARPP